jgi:shikimate kinase
VTGADPSIGRPIDKIYLIGFMTAGKTTVARRLAARLGWRAEDVDRLIEARERLTVADLFSRHGEAYFRSVEREIVKLLLPLRHTVVATGGGTFMDTESRQAISLDGLAVWLDVPLETVIARLRPDGRRPLSTDRAQLERLFAARQAVYGLAPVRIDASAAPDAIVERILDRLGPGVR